MRFVGPAAYASTEPFCVGTIAMLEVMAPSEALRVETPGWDSPETNAEIEALMLGEDSGKQ